MKPADSSEVAVDRTYPNGRILGIDVIPAQPPRGVSTIQGNFLSPAVQDEVKKYLRESDRGRTRKQVSLVAEDEEEQMTEGDLEESSKSYIELERRADAGMSESKSPPAQRAQSDKKSEDEREGGIVDVVLSDMSEPWAQTDGFWKRSLSDPYYRMMNTSGISFRDHAGSMVINLSDISLTTLLIACYRICVMLHYALPSTPCELVATSSVNSIKAQKTRHSNCG